MKGYSPNFDSKDKLEIASKTNSPFIELGVKEIKHKEDCECDECINENELDD